LFAVLLCGNSFLYGRVKNVYLKIQHGRRINVCITKFLPVEANIISAKLSRKTQEVVRHDLLFTRYFNVIETQRGVTGKKIEFAYWLDRNVEAILTAKLKVTKSYYQLFAKLYDVATGEVIMEKSFVSESKNYREIAHRLNDEIVFRFTGEKGIAHTKVVFSNNATGKKEIYVVDYDGYNLKRLTHHRSISIFPRWSPGGKKIMYTSYRRGNPDLYIMNADGTNKKALSRRQGLNTPASYSPSGEFIALTLSRGKLPNIFLLNNKTRKMRQITFGNSLDTSPYFSPNNNEIVFISGSAGRPQLYITDIFSATPKRLYTDGYSDSPAWSPDAGSIIFTMRRPGVSNFDIYVYDITKGMYWGLTKGVGSNENPSFSPDGRFIAFSSLRFRHRELYIMFMDGTGQRRIADIKGDCFTPCWSP
jgi:TolB protein